MSGKIDENLLSIVQEVVNIIEGSLALSIPEHHAATGFARHHEILLREIGEISFGRSRRDWPKLPVACIIPAAVHAVDDDFSVATVGKMLLYGAVRAVCVTDQDGASLLNKVIQFFSDDRV